MYSLNMNCGCQQIQETYPGVKAGSIFVVLDANFGQIRETCPGQGHVFTVTKKSRKFCVEKIDEAIHGYVPGLSNISSSQSVVCASDCTLIKVNDQTFVNMRPGYLSQFGPISVGS